MSKQYTVGELKQWLSEFSDDTVVLIEKESECSCGGGSSYSYGAPKILESETLYLDRWGSWGGIDSEKPEVKEWLKTVLKPNEKLYLGVSQFYRYNGEHDPRLLELEKLFGIKTIIIG